MTSNRDPIATRPRRRRTSGMGEAGKLANEFTATRAQSRPPPTGWCVTRRQPDRVGGGRLCALVAVNSFALRIAQGPADLPMVSEWIANAPETPAIFIGNRHDLCGACRNGPRLHGRRIFYDHQHSYRASTQRFGTEVEMLRRLLSDPELRAVHR